MKMNNIMVVDTEATNLTQRYIYDLGYQVLEITENKHLKSVLERQYIVKQIWENTLLFASAYYGIKRPIYIKMLRGRIARLKHRGYAFNKIKQDLKDYCIEWVGAYNCQFDKGAFEKNAKDFNVDNPFDYVDKKGNKKQVKWFCIEMMAIKYICKTQEYHDFCVKHGFIGESGYLKTSAEVVYAYITQNKDYKEPHTSLQDCYIETAILQECINRGATLSEDYKKEFLKSSSTQTLLIKIVENGKWKEFKFNYKTKVNSRKHKATILSR